MHINLADRVGTDIKENDMLDPRAELEADWNIVNAPQLMTTQELRDAGFDIEYRETLDAEAEHYAYLGAMDDLDAMEARGGPEFHVPAWLDDDIPW